MDKQSIRAIYSVILAAAAIILGGSCTTPEAHPMERPDKSITFILSSDSPGKHYFHQAAEYFRTDDREATDIVTSECQSIACVIDYLNDHANGSHWSTINLVAHGNAKTGLNLYLSDGGHKATPKRMVQEVVLRNLPRLRSDAVDSSTSIHILACGIGTNPMISLSMKSIFQTEDGVWPTVVCTDRYVIFRTDTAGQVRMVSARYWPYYYKRGYRPSASEIDQEMKSKYPADTIPWDDILHHPTEEGLTMEYHIPITFTKIYDQKTDRPNFTSQADKEDWARSQQVIMDKLQEIDMPFDQFHWQVDKRIIKDANGHKTFAVKAIGMTTSMCFLQIDR